MLTMYPTIFVFFLYMLSVDRHIMVTSHDSFPCEVTYQPPLTKLI